MKFSVFSAIFAALAILLLSAGCASDKLPSEDIEALTKYSDIIKVLKSDEFKPDSKEKYDAAKELVQKVDFYFTRELSTVNAFFNYKDMLVDAKNQDNPVFSFNYRYRDHYVRLRFFSHKMFVTRVEITEK